MSSSFALLWGKILDSSIWVKESKETRLVWVTMLAMKDQEGNVYASKVGLADRAKVSYEECMEALRVFLAPDPDDTSGVDEGRRIKEIPGGWHIVNHDLYRFSTAAKRELWREHQAEYRAKKRKRDSAKGDGMGAKGETGVKDLNDRFNNGRIPEEPEAGF